MNNDNDVIRWTSGEVDETSERGVRKRESCWGSTNQRGGSITQGASTERKHDPHAREGKAPERDCTETQTGGGNLVFLIIGITLVQLPALICFFPFHSIYGHVD